MSDSEAGGKPFRPTSRVVVCTHCGHSFDIYGHVRELTTTEHGVTLTRRVAQCSLCRRPNELAEA